MSIRTSWVVRRLPTWLPFTAVSSLALTAYRQAEATCWSGWSDLAPGVWHWLWIGPVVVAAFVSWLRSDESTGRPVAWRGQVYATVLLTVFIGASIKLWASFNPFVEVQCRQLEAERAPRDVNARIRLGDTYERLASEEYPPEWSAGGLRPAQRFDALDAWQADWYGKAEDAYMDAAELSPKDWRPLERMASLLFIMGDCDAGRRFLQLAVTRAGPTQKGGSNSRESAEYRLELARFSADWCEKDQDLPRY